MSANLKAQAQQMLDAIGNPQWRPITTGVAGGDHWYIIEDDESIAMVSANDSSDEELREPRAVFIAAAPSLVRGLLADLESLRELHRPFARPASYFSRSNMITVCNHCLGPRDWPCPTARLIYSTEELS